MGFMDKAGELAGKFFAHANEVQSLKSDYTDMSYEQLIKEKESLKGKYGADGRDRTMAINMVLDDRKNDE